MKKILTAAVFCFITLYLSPASLINGTVIDENTLQPIDYANISIFGQSTNSLLYGGVSDENGFFEINGIPEGKYTIQISFIGYNLFSRNFIITDNTYSFGTIGLKEDTKLLSEIEVVGQGSQMRFEIDRKVFSVDQNIAASGGSATEILENIPSVEVDQEGNISLRNNESVEVWINGKPSGLTAENRAQVLQQMPAESIESIEVITNPSAKYNPEGTAGIINLVLKKERRGGYYGSITGGIIYPDGGTPGGNIGGNINYSNTKIDAYLNVGYRQMKRLGASLTELWNYNLHDTIFINQEQESNGGHGGLFLRAGIDYHINSRNTISLSGFGMNGNGDNKTLLSVYQNNLMTNLLEKAYKRNNTENSNHNNFNINLDYKHDFNKKGNELLASISYSQHKRKNQMYFSQTDSIPGLNNSLINQNTSGNDEHLQFKVDYTNKISDAGKLEAGWQSNLQTRYSGSDGFNLMENTEIPEYYNIFDYKEQIHAAYITYGDRFFEKLSLQVGLRGEYMARSATQENSNFSEKVPFKNKSYFQLFPSAYLAYSITTTDEIQLNYSRRVNRPRGWQINPFKDYSDSTNISYGNPDLSPEFSSAFELNYLRSWDNHSLSASLYYRFSDNIIQRIRYRAPETMESTFTNISQSNNTGLEFISKNRLFSIINLTTSVNLFYSKIDSDSYITPYGSIEYIQSERGFSWDARILANFMFTPTFSGQITGRYNSPKVIAQGRQQANYTIDLGLRKSFFNRNLNINLNVRDLLNSRRRKSHTLGEGFEEYSESYWHGRSFGLTISYNFGNMNLQKNQRRVNQSDEAEMDMESEMTF